MHRFFARGRVPKALFLLALAAGACRNATASGDEASARTEPSSSAYSNPKRFERELATTLKRWSSVESPVDCKPLVPEADLPSCSAVHTALGALKQALPAGQRSAVIQRSGALALSAQRAAEKLRQSGLEQLFDKQPPTTPSAQTRSVGPPLPPGFVPRPRASSSASAPDLHAHVHTENVHKNPTLTAIREYARLSSLALRQLAVYLEHGPRDARAEALRELVRLSREEPRWKNLEKLAKEARLTETDPELRKELDKLVATLRAERENSG